MKTIAKIAVVALVMGTLAVGAFASPLVPTNVTGRAPAHGTSFANVYLVGGEITAVSLVGDGDTDLDVYIYDGAGRLVTRAIGYTDRELFSFRPASSGTYRFEVRNLGGVYNNYSMVVR